MLAREDLVTRSSQAGPMHRGLRRPGSEYSSGGPAGRRGREASRDVARDRPCAHHAAARRAAVRELYAARLDRSKRSGDPLRGVPVAVERRRAAGKRRRRGRPRRSRPDRRPRARSRRPRPCRPTRSTDASSRTGRDTSTPPSGARPSRSRSREPATRRRRTRGSPAARAARRSRRAGSPLRPSTAAVRGCAGSTTGSSSRERPVDDPAQPLGPHVRLAVDGRDDVGAGRVRRRHALPRDRREAERRVGHDVADDLGAAADALRRAGSPPNARRGRGAAPPAGRPRSAPAPRASTDRRSGGRLDVRERDPGRRRGTGAGERRVRVAEDERRRRAPRPRRPLGSGRQRVDVGRPQVEAVGRLVQPELVDEDLRQLVVPVLPVWTTTSSIPASRSATESGAALTNCGRLPTTVTTRTAPA